MREDSKELRFLRRHRPRLHLDQIRPHGLAAATLAQFPAGYDCDSRSVQIAPLESAMRPGGPLRMGLSHPRAHEVQAWGSEPGKRHPTHRLRSTLARGRRRWLAKSSGAVDCRTT